MMKKCVFYIVLSMPLLLASSYEEGQKTAKHFLKEQPTIAKNPDNFIAMPAKELDAISSSAKTHDSQITSFIQESSDKRPQFKWDKEDALLEQSKAVVEKPLAILKQHYQGTLSSETITQNVSVTCEESAVPFYVTCHYHLKPTPMFGEKTCEEAHEKSIESCIQQLIPKPNYEIKICEEKGETYTETCERRLQVMVQDKLACKEVDISAYLADGLTEGFFHQSGSMVINLTTHQVLSAVNKNYSCQITGFVPMDVSKAKLQDIQIYSLQQKPWLIEGDSRVFELYASAIKPVQIRVVSNHNGLVVKIDALQKIVGTYDPGMFSRTRYGYIGSWLLLKVRYGILTPTKVHEAWEHNCHDLDHKAELGLCKKSSLCVDGPSSKFINGLSVYKPCWHYKDTFQCDYPSQNDCKGLRALGCVQIDSKCSHWINTVCVQYQQTMQCIKDFEDTWQGDCEDLKVRTPKWCTWMQKTCLEGKDSRMLMGQPITKDCWKEKHGYQCHYPAHNNCESLRIPACKEIHHRCIKEVNGACVVIERTYRCLEGTQNEWHHDCHDLEDKAMHGICERVEHIESEAETQIMDGYPIHAHWQKTNVYRCQYPSKQDCAMWVKEGCTEVKKTCKQTKHNTCLVWEKTFNCSKSHAKTRLQGQQVPLCLDGTCEQEASTPNNELMDALSKLSLVKEWQKQMSQDILEIFKGEALECSMNPIGFGNCCRLSGWGKDMGLVECHEKEEQLARLRQQGLCVAVGKYCAHRTLGVCTSEHLSFCCFKTKLQKLFQEQGKKLLSLNFGKPNAPQCRGFSPLELQNLNLDAMDWSSMYSDLSQKLPSKSLEEVQSQVRLKVQALTESERGSK